MNTKQDKKDQPEMDDKQPATNEELTEEDDQLTLDSDIELEDLVDSIKEKHPSKK